MKIPFAVSTLLWCSFAVMPALEHLEGLEGSSVEPLHALIVPRAEEEAWKRLPWLSDLWEARRRASAEGKPIFLWEMDGHPLGCT